MNLLIDKARAKKHLEANYKLLIRMNTFARVKKNIEKKYPQHVS